VVNGVQGEMENKWKAEIDLQPTRYHWWAPSTFGPSPYMICIVHSQGKKIFGKNFCVFILYSSVRHRGIKKGKPKKEKWKTGRTKVEKRSAGGADTDYIRRVLTLWHTSRAVFLQETKQPSTLEVENKW